MDVLDQRHELYHLATSTTKDFNGLPIVFREDGYINATKAAEQFGKDVREFFKLEATKLYMEALEAMMGIPLIDQKQDTRGRHGTKECTEVLAESLNVGFSDLWISKKGRYGGTFLHPKQGIRLGQWLDVRFTA